LEKGENEERNAEQKAGALHDGGKVGASEEFAAEKFIAVGEQVASELKQDLQSGTHREPPRSYGYQS